jgi:hypothetical protein
MAPHAIFQRRRRRDHSRLIVKGGQDWVEGSLQVADALKAAKENWPANITFGTWLKENKLDHWNHHDRSALINLASDIELARSILTETENKSYKLIWQQHKKRFVQMDKTPRITSRKPRRKKGSGNLFREMKH